MAKRSTVKPDWLDDMLVIWGKQSDRDRGWYSVNPMLKSGIPMPARSQEPNDYSDYDFSQLQAAIDGLERHHRLVLRRAYKPWSARAVEDELALYGVGSAVWLKWLHEAAARLALAMERAKDEA